VFHEAERNAQAYFTYMKVWKETPIDSSAFKNTGFDNPNLLLWPYKSSSLQAEAVKLGKFKLNTSQVARLGKN